MTAMRNLYCLCALLGALHVAPGGEEGRLIGGFNSAEELDRWSWRTAVKELASEHSTEGDRSLKVVLNGKQTNWPGFNTKSRELLSGWGDYDLLTLDIHNAGDKIATVAVRIDDAKSSSSDWTTYFYAGLKAFPGPNSFRIELKQLVTPNRVRTIDPAEITRLHFFMDYRKFDKAREAVLYFDNLALRKAKATELPPSLKAFDFGPDTSTVWPGFGLVTHETKFSEQTGYGFSAMAYARDLDYKVPDDIGRDSIYLAGGRATIFSVKMDPGKYKVWVLAGDTAGRDLLRRGFSVSAEGRESFRRAQRFKSFLDAMDPLAYAYRESNASLWDIFVKPGFDDIIFEAECADGVLDIAFEPDNVLYLCGLAIWPAEDTASAEALAKVNEARRTSYDERFREIKPKVDEAPPSATARERARGFILTSPDYLKDVTPYYRPSDEDRIEKLAIAACADEREPAILMVYPLRDQKLKISVSDLAGPGRGISSTRVRVERTVYRYVSRGLDSYEVRPAHLVPHTIADMEQDVPQQFWITAHVPKDAKPAAYRGTVRVSGDGAPVSVPLEVRVYPFELEKPDVTYAHVYYVPKEIERIEMDLRCMVQHGFNSVTAGMPTGQPTKADGKLQIDFSRDNVFMRKMKEVGMTGPVPLFNMSIQGSGGGKSYPHLAFTSRFGYTITSQAYLDDLTALTRLIIENAKKSDWLPVIMYPSTEVSNDQNLGPEFNRKLIQAIRKAGEVVCVSSVNRPRDVASVHDLDIIMYNAGVPINESTIKAAHDAGCQLWFQNIGGTRFNEGLYLLRTGAMGRRQWVMNCYLGNPYSDFEYAPWTQRLFQNSQSLLYPSKDGTLPTVGLERMREGVDDYRYFLTLKRLIERAEKTGEAVAQARKAEKEYAQMTASAPVEIDNQKRLIREDGLAENKKFRDQKVLDGYRRRVAELIIELKEKLPPGPRTGP